MLSEDVTNVKWHKKCNRLTQFELLPLGLTLIYITGNDLKTLTTKPWCPLFQKLFCDHQTLIRTLKNKLFCVMFINQCTLRFLILPIKKKCKQQLTEKNGMIDVEPVNKLMITSPSTQPTPLPWTSTILQEEKICMSGLYTAHIQFSITPEKKF